MGEKEKKRRRKEGKGDAEGDAKKSQKWKKDSFIIINSSYYDYH